MRPRTSPVAELQKAVLSDPYSLGDRTAVRRMGNAIRVGILTIG